MADETTVDASGIEVDDAAMYFGVTESSDVLHAMMAMPREQAMVQFFEVLSDIVLRPGDFDFEAASERMQCEGGEIYYLVAGHLGLMSMPDPLLQALGMPDSSGETTGQAIASISAVDLVRNRMVGTREGIRPGSRYRRSTSASAAIVILSQRSARFMGFDLIS